MIAPLLILSGVLLQVTNLDDAVQALEEGKSSIAVSSKVGRAAARAAADSGATADSSRLQALITIAVKGRAEAPLGRALVRIVADARSRENAGIAAQALAKLDAKLRQRLLRTPPKGWGERLEHLARSEDAAVVKASAVLLAPRIDAELLGRLLRGWIADEHEDLAVCLLGQAEQFPDPLKAFDVLARLEVSGEPAHRALGRAVSALVLRDPKVAAEALRRARMTSSAAVVRSLSSLYERRQVEQATEILVSLVDPDDLENERVVAAALRCAGEMLVSELEDTVRELAVGHKVPARVRRAAVWALARLAYKDRPTIDLLIRLLKDRDVASAAHEALVFKTGVKLRGRAQAWRLWSRGAKLPAGPPADLDERLQRARELRLRFGRLKVRAARRAERKAGRR